MENVSLLILPKSMFSGVEKCKTKGSETLHPCSVFIALKKFITTICLIIVQNQEKARNFRYVNFCYYIKLEVPAGLRTVENNGKKATYG